MRRLRTQLLQPGPMSLMGLLILAVVHLAPWQVPFGSELWGKHGNVVSQHNTLRWQWDALWELRWNEWLTLPSFAPFESGLQFTEPLVGIALLFAPAAGMGTVIAFNLAVLGSFLLVGWAMYLAGKELFGHPAAGVAAAATTMFCSWRVEMLTTLNILSTYFALMAFVFLLRWLAEPTWKNIIPAAVLSYVQLITVPQVGIVALYTSAIFLTVHWAARRLPLNPIRLRQLVITGGAFAVANIPWLVFFRPASTASRGLLRTESMEYYRQGLGGLANTMGLTSWVVVFAVLGLFGAVVGKRRDHRTGLLMAALVAGAGVVFLFALGPYRRTDGELRVLPGLFAFRYLPFLDAYRVPGRLAQLTPMWVGLFAGGGWWWLCETLRERIRYPVHVVACALPLLCFFVWPEVTHESVPPLDARPKLREVAKVLNALPQDAVIAPVPVKTHHGDAPYVEEWVHEHRRPQLAGEKSRIPELFQHAHYALGQWPLRGTRELQMMGMTHVVTPRNWVMAPDIRSHTMSIGYRAWRETLHWTVWEVPPPTAGIEPSWSWNVPSRAVAKVGMTAALFEAGRTTAVLAGHDVAQVVWTRDGETTSAEAFVFTTSFPSSTKPHRLNIPTPEEVGRYTLKIEYSGQSWRGPVDITTSPSTWNTPITDINVTVEDAPTSVRMREYYGLRVHVEAPKDGPFLLATSIEDAPDSRGATVLRYRYLPKGGGPEQKRKAMPFHSHHTLPFDLAPGEGASTTWYLQAPWSSGLYDLEIRLESYEVAGKKMPWIPLIQDFKTL